MGAVRNGSSNKGIKMIGTYVIPECNFDLLQSQIDKINKAANKLGMKPVTYSISGVHSEYFRVIENNQVVGAVSKFIRGEDFKPESQTKIETRRYFNVVIDGEQPKYNGWEFCATLMPIPTDDGIENMVRKVPGCEYTIPQTMRDKVNHCDHCGYIRRRNETYVVHHDNGDWKVVGSSCIKDFLGHSDPHAIAQYLEFLSYFDEGGLSEVDEERSYSNRESYVYDVESFLTTSCSVVRNIGWRSKKQQYEEGGIATVNIALLAYLPHSKLTPNELNLIRRVVITQEDKDKAKEIKAWLKTIDPQTENEYMYNLSLLSRAECVNYKSLGILCSACVAYDRQLARQEKSKNLYGNSEFVGKVKDRLVMKLKINRIFEKDSDFGLSRIHHMSDENGNYIVWFASNGGGFKEGDEIIAKATIKNHSEYKGTKQTIVNRVSEV